MDKTKIECQECGKALSEEQRPCPSCGSSKRNYCYEASAAIGLLASIEVKHKDEKGFLKFESKDRNKISGTTKRKTRETILFDRTDPKFTRKFHHVEEINEDGKPEVVHHEDIKCPAKRRPKTYRP